MKSYLTEKDERGNRVYMTKAPLSADMEDVADAHEFNGKYQVVEIVFLSEYSGSREDAFSLWLVKLKENQK